MSPRLMEGLCTNSLKVKPVQPIQPTVEEEDEMTPKERNCCFASAQKSAQPGKEERVNLAPL